MSSNAIAEPASLWMVCSPAGSMTAGERKSIEVSVSDENGEPVANATVSFSIEVIESNSPDDCSPEVKVWQTTQTTDARGVTYNTFRTFECASGTYLLKATSGNASDGLRILVKSSQPEPKLSFSLSSDISSPAPGETVTFTVVVKKDNAVAQGETVTFRISTGDANASLGTTSTTTDSDGRAQTTLTLGNNASGSYTVQASVGSKSSEITVTVEPPPPPPEPKVSLSISSDTSSPAPGGTVTFTVVVEKDDAVAQGETVTFSVNPNDGNASLGSPSTTTGSDGRAQTTLTLGNNASGTYTVQASAGGKSAETTVTVETPPPPPPEISLSLSSDTSSPAPGGTVTFTVVFKKDNAVAQGETVTFSVRPNDGNASLGSPSTTTDSRGRAQTTLTLGNNASGSYTVQASVGSKSAETTVTVEPPPPPKISLSISSDTSSPAPGGTVTFTVVVEKDNTLAQGETVTFRISTGDGNASLGSPSTTTDSRGRAQTTLTLGNNASGSYTVQASVGSKSAEITVTVLRQSTPPEPTPPEPTPPEPTQPEPTQPEPTPPEPTQPEPTQPEPTQPEPTPPEPIQVLSKLSDPGQIGFSELMIASKGGLHSLSQWIELYNNSETKPVNLMGWKLEIEARDADGGHRHVVIPLEDLQIPPNKTALIVTWSGRNSGDFSEDRIYRFFNHHSHAFEQNAHRNMVLGRTGFYLKLSDPHGAVSDVVGNLDGNRQTEDEPAWQLPTGTTENGNRTSLMRRYDRNTRVPFDGSISENWVATSALQLAVRTYWGRETDIGNPGYRAEGALPVTLSYFRAERLDTDVVVIEWTTAAELDNAGFNILRSQSKAGHYVKVNRALITGAGTTSERNTYTWTDTTTKPNTLYYYRIEDISHAGERRTLTTTRLRGVLSAESQMLTQWASFKKAGQR